MRVLHFSDLHLRQEKLADQMVLIEQFLDDAHRQHEATPIDLIVFTGDLAFAGKREQFDLARTAVLDPLLDRLGLTTDELVLVRGNHDTDISLIDKFAEQGLRAGLASRSDVSALLDDRTALMRYDERGSAWREFVRGYLGNRFLGGGLAQVTTVTVDGNTIGIAALDSAWRATGASDDGDFQHLLVGDRQVKEAVAALRGADVRVLAMHHPLDWLAGFDATDVRRELERGCHLLLTGHTHVSDPRALVGASGSFAHSAAGSLYAGRRHINAFTIIDVDLAAASLDLQFRSYQPGRECFDTGVDVAQDGHIVLPLRTPLTPAAGLAMPADQPDAARRTRQHRLDVLRERSVLVDLLHDRDQAQLGDLLVPPVFLPLPHDQYLVARDPETGRRPGRTDPPQAIRGGARCVIAVGDEASGLSSALDWIALSDERDGRPVVKLTLGDLKGGLQGVEKAMRAALFAHGYSLKPADPLPDAVVLVDDIRSNEDDDRRLSRLAAHIAGRPGSLFVLGCRAGDQDDLLTALEQAGVTPSVHHLGPFGRPELRELIGHLNIRRSGVVFRAVTGMLEREGLARTPFIMAALVSVVGADETFTAVGNETAVLDAYADLLLGRSDVGDDSRIAMDYRLREHLLASLAERMLVINSARLPRLEVERFLVEYFESIGWSEPVSDVIKALITRRVLLSYGDGTLAFRQPALLGLFAAKRMLDDALFQDKILRAPLRHPAIVRHAAALRRNDRDLLIRIHSMLRDSPASEVADRFFEALHRADESSDAAPTSQQDAERLIAALDASEEKGAGEQLALQSIGEEDAEARRKSAEAEEAYDSIWDEMHATPVQDVIVPNQLPPIWQFEAALCLVSGVLRSSELVADTDLKATILKETLSGWAALSAVIAHDEEVIAGARTAFSRLFNMEPGDKAEQQLDEMVQILPIMVSMGDMAIYLASRKLSGLLRGVLDDDEFMRQPGPALMATLLAIEVRAEHWIDYAGKLLDRHGDKAIIGRSLELATFSIYRTEQMRPQEVAALEAVLVRLITSESRPKPLKSRQVKASRVAQGLRRMRNQAAISQGLTWQDPEFLEEL